MLGAWVGSIVGFDEKVESINHYSKNIGAGKFQFTFNLT
jgi:hypothetical protein